MKRTHRAAGVLVALAGAGALALSSTSSASAAATWTLSKSPQELCVHPDKGHPGAYFIASITGSTSTNIDAHYEGLPPGTIGGEGRIHPEELENGNGKYNAIVPVDIQPAPAGEYEAALVASDGTETQRMPIKITYKEDCLG